MKKKQNDCFKNLHFSMFLLMMEISHIKSMLKIVTNICTKRQKK